MTKGDGPFGDVHFLAPAIWGRTFFGTILTNELRDNFTLMGLSLILFDITITRMYTLNTRRIIEG